MNGNEQGKVFVYCYISYAFSQMAPMGGANNKSGVLMRLGISLGTKYSKEGLANINVTMETESGKVANR